MNPDALAELEEERRYLLRSLRDLDAEYAAGDVDEDDYVTLRDGYTKRAADVLREIEAGRASLPPAPPRRWARRSLIALAVAAVAGGLSWFLATTLGERVDDPGASSSVAEQLSEARRLQNSDPLAAVELYDAVLQQEPGNAEALTYSGWLAYLTSRQLEGAARDDAVAAVVIPKLREAIASDEDYADPHCFLGIVGLNEAANAVVEPEEARAELERCLALDPPAFAQGLVEEFLRRVDAPTTTTGPTGPTAPASPTTTTTPG